MPGAVRADSTDAVATSSASSANRGEAGVIGMCQSAYRRSNEPRQLRREEMIAFRADDHVALPRKRGRKRDLRTKHSKHFQRTDVFPALRTAHGGFQRVHRSSSALCLAGSWYRHGGCLVYL